MILLLIVLLAWLVFSTLCIIDQQRDIRQWRKLENLQARRVTELQAQLESELIARQLIDQFRTRPGMATVSAEYAKKYLDLEAENKKLHLEAGNLRLEAAKYMDLYRNERYKPLRKHT